MSVREVRSFRCLALLCFRSDRKCGHLAEGPLPIAPFFTRQQRFQTPKAQNRHFGTHTLCRSKRGTTYMHVSRPLKDCRSLYCPLRHALLLAPPHHMLLPGRTSADGGRELQPLAPGCSVLHPVHIHNGACSILPLGWRARARAQVLDDMKARYAELPMRWVR